MRLQLMMMAALSLALAGAMPAKGDLLRIADGTHRIGRIVAQETSYLSVMIDSNGIRSLVRIPRSELYYIVPAGTTDPLTGQSVPAEMPAAPIALLSDAPASAPASDNPTTQPSGPATIILRGPLASAATQSATRGGKPKLAPASPEFFTELGKLLAGKGGDLSNPAEMSPQNRKYWDALLIAEEAGDKRAALDNMIALANAYERQPARLHLLAMRARNMRFSTWMAQMRWDVFMLPPRRPIFDTSNVTEIERPELIQLLRSKTQEAVEPLRVYFPQERPRTAATSASLPSAPVAVAPMTPANNPLNGITVGNTLEVREKALFAAAILGAQLRLEPDMPAIDRLFLAEQSRHVQAVVARTGQLLPAATAAKEKADREKRIADEKAARQQR